MMKRTITIVTFFMFSITFAQNNEKNEMNLSDYQISSERYLTDDRGNILMYVNIWGEVKRPGNHLVYEGIDLATLLSIVGGTTADANLQKIRLHREIPDGDEVITYELDLSSFISSGDRSSFVKIMPNDMILVPTRTVPLILKKISTTSIILNLINLYLNIKSR